MAVTMVYDARLNTNYSYNSAVANGSGIAFGTIDCTGQSTVAGGITMTLPFINVAQVDISPHITTATSLFFTYDKTNTKMQFWQAAPLMVTTTAAMLEVAAGVDVSALDSIPFHAVGSD